MARFAVALVIALLCLCTVAHGLHVAFKPNVDQCFAYDATRRSEEEAVRVDVSYRSLRTLPVSGVTLTAHVRGPNSVKIADFKLNPATTSGEAFHFLVTVGGLHRICFLAQGTDKPLPFEVEMIAENEHRELPRDRDGDVAARSRGPSLKEYEGQVTRIESLIDAVASEAVYLTERQFYFELGVSRCFLRVVIFAGINFLLMLGAGAWQVITLRRFFKQKKIV